MNSPARRWVKAMPEDSRCCSIWPCMRAKRKSESISGMMPDSLTTCSTPACLAASMKLDWTSSIAGSEDDVSIARSTPRNGSASVSGRAMSPSTTCTPGSVARWPARVRLRTSARTGTPCADRRRTTAPPFSPLAPVTNSISATDSELAHHCRHVEDAPVFADQSVAGEFTGVGVVDVERLTGWWNAHEVTAMRTLHAGECRHHVTLGDHEIRREPQVRQCVDEHAEKGLETFAVAGELGWKRLVVVWTIWSDQVIRGINVVSVHHPVVQLLEGGFVALWGF